MWETLQHNAGLDCFCEEYISNYRKLAAKTVCLQPERQHDDNEDKHDTNYINNEHLHAQIAPVSTHWEDA